jgi:ABC-type multidrug transport system fused ATPase/permease subunit
MIPFFRGLYPLLDRRTKVRLLIACGAMLFLSLLEALAFVALIPLMQILTAPNMQTTSSSVTFASDFFGNPSSSQLALTLAVITVGLYIVKSLAAVAILRWATTFALAEESAMLHRLMGTYLSAPYEQHLGRNSNEFVRTLEISLPMIFRMAMVQSFNAVGDIFSVAFVGVILAISNLGIAVAAATYFTVVVVGYQRVAQHFIAKAAQEIHNKQAKEIQAMHQSLAAVKDVKVRGAEKYFADEVGELRERLIGPYRTVTLSGLTPRYVLELAMMGAAAVIAFVAFSTESVNAATATVGVFLAGGFRMLAPLNKVVFAISQARASMPSLDQLGADLKMARSEDVDEALQLSEEVQVENLRPRVALTDVTFSYVPGVPVLDHVTFDIHEGEAMGLVGGSGAGKSTLVDVLLGLLEVDAGEVLVDGWPIHSVRRQWQSMIGYVPQTIVLFDGTVRANVAFGVTADEVDDDRVWEVLELAQLTDVVHQLPAQLDGMIGEGGVQLSGGQRQRLGVARALYHRPRILMFDEATSALDNETEFKLTEVLETFKGRLTTITIAHRLSTVRRCDRLLYLEQGKLVASGTFSELDDTIPGFTRMVELASLHS